MSSCESITGKLDSITIIDPDTELRMKCINLAVDLGKGKCVYPDTEEAIADAEKILKWVKGD